MLKAVLCMCVCVCVCWFSLTLSMIVRRTLAGELSFCAAEGNNFQCTSHVR